MINTLNIWLKLGLAAAIVAGLFFTYKASKKAFENKFQIPYAVEYAKPYQDTIKTVREQLYLTATELDTVTAQLFFTKADLELSQKLIESGQLVIKQLTNQKAELTKLNKVLSSGTPCYEVKRGLFGGKFIKTLIDCETGEAL